MKKKYIIYILLFAIFFIPNIVRAENKTPSVDSTEKVYDFANIIPDEKEETLRKAALSFMEEFDMDLVIVTIDYNPYGRLDSDIDLYGKDFYDYNKFGLNSSRDGILFLIDMYNRAPAFVTTGKAQLIYDDARREATLENAYTYLTSENYYGAFKSYINDAVKYANSGIPNSNRYYCVDEEGEYYYCKPKAVNWAITIGAAILGSLIPLFIHLRKYKGIKLATNANEYMKNVEMNGATDQFLTTFTSRVRRSSSSGGSGGGHSGGSSISRGSSGMSHSSSVGRHF